MGQLPFVFLELTSKNHLTWDFLWFSIIFFDLFGNLRVSLNIKET